MRVAPKGVRPEVTEAVERAAELALELKATDVVALDLASIWGATDYFLLASGRSDVQVKAIAENIVDQLKKEEIRPEHIEGLQGWPVGTDRLHRLRRTRVPRRGAPILSVGSTLGRCPEARLRRLISLFRTGDDLFTAVPIEA